MEGSQLGTPGDTAAEHARVGTPVVGDSNAWSPRAGPRRAANHADRAESASALPDDRADVLVAQRPGQVAGDQAVDDLDGVDVPGGLQYLEERPVDGQRRRADVEKKFRGNVAERWPRERTDAILQALWSLERTQDLSLLLGQLALPK